MLPTLSGMRLAQEQGRRVGGEHEASRSVFDYSVEDGGVNWRRMRNRIGTRFYVFKRDWFVAPYQRLTRGYADKELWSLDASIAQWVLPRLRAYKEANCGHPSDLTEELWNVELVKMIRAFEIIADDCTAFGEENERIINEGLDSFRRWFRGLWL